jgi:16S rRNA (guanine(527)-N(7))-methyltransferase RsmG
VSPSSLQEVLDPVLREPFLEPVETELLRPVLLRYWEEILVWNRRFNLVSRRTAVPTLARLTLESLALGRALERRRAGGLGGPVLDLGSGAGFPAVPLRALHPDLEFHLVEIREKKAFFLERLGRLLGWTGFHVHRRDVATLAGPFPGEIPEGPAAIRFPVVTGKALGSIPGLERSVAALLAPGGVFATYAGVEEAEEAWAGSAGRAGAGPGGGLEPDGEERVDPEGFRPFRLLYYRRAGGAGKAS